jgi:acyl-CoA synthetase (AMP-forming)/AMP-acid ligase II
MRGMIITAFAGGDVRFARYAEEKKDWRVLTGDMLRFSAQRNPAKAAIIFGARRLGYGALDQDANRFANAVLARGLAKGDAIAIIARNVPEYAVYHFGCARTGCLSVNLMPAYAPDEIAAILARTEARLVVVEAAFEDKLAAVKDELPRLDLVVVIGAPGGAPGIDGAVDFDGFLAPHGVAPPAVKLSPSDPYAMTFTGGTTGVPKGALVSHYARFVSSYTTAIEHEMSENDVVGVVTPLYHAVGLLIWFQAAILVGATCVFIGGWDAECFADAAAECGITTVFMVPVQLAEILSDDRFDGARLAGLKMMACAGAITTPELKAEFARKMPAVKFIDHYGQSETGPLTFLKYFHPKDKAATVGKPALGADVAVVDADGKPVAVGQVGELVARGPFMMEGYYRDRQETAAYFRHGDGWGWSGDLATVDADGFITLVGRSKDMIVSGGVNIYPREVEKVLAAHPQVRDCTVFGIPDEKWGEALAAYVVADGGLDADALAAHCARHLARFKRPKVVRFMDAIPKTPSGKVQKPKLRAAFLAEPDTG